MSTRKLWEIMKSLKTYFLCAAGNNHMIFLIHTRKNMWPRIMWKSSALKNNILSNPEGKLIFTFKVFTSTNTKITSNLGLLRNAMSPTTSHWAQGIKASLSALTLDSVSGDF
jgi:hypothetical protein